MGQETLYLWHEHITIKQREGLNGIAEEKAADGSGIDGSQAAASLEANESSESRLETTKTKLPPKPPTKSVCPQVCMRPARARMHLCARAREWVADGVF